MQARRHEGRRGGWKQRVAAPALALAMVAGSASIASAGERFVNLPLLDSELDRERGSVGSTVNVEVDTDHIAEHCITGPSDFAAQYFDLSSDAQNPTSENTPLFALVEVIFDEDYEGDPSEELAATDPKLFALIALLNEIYTVWDLYHDDDPTGLDERVAATFGFGFGEVADVVDEADGEVRYLDFIAPTESFDPTTGEGSIEVLDLAPGLHTLMVGCLGIPADLDSNDLRAALDAAVEHVAASDAYPIETDGDRPGDQEAVLDLFASTSEVLYAELMDLRAGSWNEFCIEDADGACPGETELAPDPETDPAPAPDPSPATPAAPVRSQPAYTG